MFREWQTSSRTYPVGKWADVDADKWGRIMAEVQSISVVELEGLIAALKGLQSMRRTAAQRRAVVVRNQRMQGIAAPRQRGPQSESPDQSSETTGSELKPQ